MAQEIPSFFSDTPSASPAGMDITFIDPGTGDVLVVGTGQLSFHEGMADVDITLNELGEKIFGSVGVLNDYLSLIEPTD